MTFVERRELEAARPDLAKRLRWTAGPRPSLTALIAKPCPFLEGSRCSVYDVRPYNCRRWMCGRTERDQPVEDAPVPLVVLRSKELLNDFQDLQAAAQPWALAHGWREDWK